MVTFAGLGSGIDFGNITTQLVNAERIPLSALNTRKTGVNRQISLLGDLATKLSALSTAASSLDTANELRVYKAQSSDDTRVRVTASSVANVGTYDITVNALASAQSTRSRTFAARDVAIGGGEVTFTVGSATPVDVTWDSTATLDDVAAQINEAVDGVRASVLYDGSQYRLIVSGTQAGASNAITFAETGVGLGLNDVGATQVAAQNASVTINGTTITRSSNTISDALSGLTLELRSQTPSGGAATRVEASEDTAGQRAKLDAFVEAVNEVTGFINGQLGSEVLEAASSLRGDTTLQTLQRRLSTTLTQIYAPDGTERSLSAFGLRFDREGVMSITDTALTARTSSDPDGLGVLFAGSGERPGVAQSLKDLITEYTRAATGVITSKQDGLRTRVRGIDDQIEAINERASGLESRLRKQFSAADSLIAGLNSQASFLTALFQ
jgi:flagellar hook-associated protein 2